MGCGVSIIEGWPQKNRKKEKKRTKTKQMNNIRPLVILGSKIKREKQKRTMNCDLQHERSNCNAKKHTIAAAFSFRIPGYPEGDTCKQQGKLPFHSREYPTNYTKLERLL